MEVSLFKGFSNKFKCTNRPNQVVEQNETMWTRIATIVKLFSSWCVASTTLANYDFPYFYLLITQMVDYRDYVYSLSCSVVHMPTSYLKEDFNNKNSTLAWICMASHNFWTLVLYFVVAVADNEPFLLVFAVQLFHIMLAISGNWVPLRSINANRK